MTVEDFKNSLPVIETINGLEIQHVHSALLRSAGFLEAMEGIKANPEIASRMNLNELRLLQTLVRLVFTLQCKNLDQDRVIQEGHKVNEQLRVTFNELNRKIAQVQDANELLLALAKPKKVERK
jgi:hypothetical protein